jgi:hypothetical protein
MAANAKNKPARACWLMKSRFPTTWDRVAVAKLKRLLVL